MPETVPSFSKIVHTNHPLQHLAFFNMSVIAQVSYSCLASLVLLLATISTLYLLPGRSHRDIEASDVSNDRSLTTLYRPV
jgi:hypothetical protein